MKFLTVLLACGFSLIVLADDTEIYGASEIDIDRRINSNVMFVMDTSGSMGTQVQVTKPSYDNNIEYNGSYDKNSFYINLNDRSSDKYNIRRTLQSNESTNCTGTVNLLNNEGRALANLQQKSRWWGWIHIYEVSNRKIRCDQGSAYWLYSGNYMNWHHDNSHQINKKRIDIVVDVVKDLTESLSNINLGLMRFDTSSDGGMVDVPITDISISGPLIKGKVGNYSAQGGTPLEETYYEAVKYYRGENWIYGNDSKPNESIASSRSGTTYTSPISATCQKNHIILLTDGDPTNDTSANDDIRTLVDSMALPPGLSDTCSGNGQCMDELAYWLRNADQSDDFIGEQNITTYTIGGFGDISGVDLLKRTAKWGGGKYFEANDTKGLTTVLESIFLDILSTDSTFTAPAVSVNAFNASEHRDELFYALFRPDDNAKWGGNLKKYSLNEDGLIHDSKNAAAIDTGTGFFKDSAKDFWNNTNENDGKNVTLGGMANLLVPANRTVYSDSGNSLSSFSSVATAATLDMGTADSTEVNKLKSWVTGIDVLDEDGDNSTSDSRQSIGDPLHTEPVVITYGGTDDNPDSTIYFSTNEGFIHAVNTNTGAEQFAFIPTELHKTQKTFYENTISAGGRPYGMDGPITNWFYDKNQNNVLMAPGSSTIENDEHVYIYAGMRRGGRSYYALDVTHRSNPRLLFKIQGGVTNGFEKLGQSWSKMTVAKVKFNGAARFVLFFTGGYDTNQDGNNVQQADTLGNAIYMVDATSGELLWTASNEDADLNIANMTNSMPASLAAVDITGEGYVDYLFAADTGGRVFRIDIKQNNAGKTDFATGGVIASLAGNDAASNRRFYNKPNISLVKDKQNGDHLTIAIGSGHRAHPIFNKAIKDRFYVIKDFNPYNTPATYNVKTEAATTKTSLSDGESADTTKLYNATALMTQGDTAFTSSMQELMKRGGGWYVTFANEGEKVLSQSTTFSGAIIFTTFSPSRGTAVGCGPDTGQSRTYALNQKNAMSVIDLDGDGDLDANDTSVILTQSGIAPRPVVIYRPDGGKTIAIGTENIEDDRFDETPPPSDCAEKGTCPTKEQKCTTNNCYVVPQYWRQNETIQ